MSDFKLHQARRDLSEAWQKEEKLLAALEIMNEDLKEAIKLINEMRAQWIHSWAKEKCAKILAKHGIEYPIFSECVAKQVSDQMTCDRCLISWDVNDPHPPKCGKNANG